MKKFFKYTLVLSIIILGVYALAEEGGGELHHHEGGIPRVVYYQALNFFALLVLFHFLLRKKIVSFFDKRHETLKAAVNESRRLREEVEKKHQDYSVKLQALNSSATQTLEKIKKEAEEAKTRIVQEAKKAAESIEAETNKTIELEIQKAKKILFQETLDLSLKGAEGILENKVDQKDQQRLQSEFLGKIEAMK